MRVYKCDRCGAINEVYYPINKRKFLCYEVAKVNPYFRSNFYLTRNEIELCEDCCKEYDKIMEVWLGGKK